MCQLVHTAVIINKMLIGIHYIKLFCGQKPKLEKKITKHIGEKIGTFFYSEVINVLIRLGNCFQWVDSPDQVKRNSLNLGICIPASCSALDLQMSLQYELDNVFLPEKLKAVVQVDPILCTVRGDMCPYTMAYYITRYIVR